MATINLTEGEQDLIMKALNCYEGTYVKDREEEALSEGIFNKFRAEARVEKIEFTDRDTAMDARDILRKFFKTVPKAPTGGSNSLIFDGKLTSKEAMEILQREGMTIPEAAIKEVD